MGSVFFHSPKAQYLGFHGARVHSQNYKETLGEDTEAKVWNAAVAVNLIPFIGNIIAGIAHIAAGLKTGNKGFILRGLVECTVVGGVLLAIVDIITTIGRMCMNPSEEETEPLSPPYQPDKQSGASYTLMG